VRTSRRIIHSKTYLTESYTPGPRCRSSSSMSGEADDRNGLESWSRDSASWERRLRGTGREKRRRREEDYNSGIATTSMNSYYCPSVGLQCVREALTQTQIYCICHQLAISLTCHDCCLISNYIMPPLSPVDGHPTTRCSPLPCCISA
jgi:hypothetical protein